MKFGRSSEKLDRQIEQLELRLEALQQNDAEKVAALPEAIVKASRRRGQYGGVASAPATGSANLSPKQEACPDCGGKLKHLGEDVSEMLEIEPLRFKVIRQVRPKLACACCERIVQAEAPSRPIARGVAGPGLWHMFSCRNLAITCRCTVNRRFTLEKKWSWIAPRWRLGVRNKPVVRTVGGSTATSRNGGTEVAR